MVPNMVQRAKNFYYPIWVWCQKFFIGAKNFCSVPMVPKKKLDLDELRHYIRYIMSRRDHMSLDIARPRFNKEKNRWVVDLRKINKGRQHFISKGQAEHYRSLHKAELQEGITPEQTNSELSIGRVVNMFVKSYTADYNNKEISETVYIKYNQALQILANAEIGDPKINLYDRNIVELTPGEVQEELMPQIAGDRSRKTITYYMSIYKKLFLFAVKKGCRTSNPFENITIKTSAAAKAKKFNSSVPADRIQPETVQKIYDHLAYPVNVMAWFAGETGVRQAELLVLTWADIDFDKSTVKISKALKGKQHLFVGSTKTEHGMNRIIPVPDSLMSTLKKLYLKNGRPELDKLIFKNSFNNRFTAGGLRKHLKRACKRAGLQSSFRWHDFRHYFASSRLDYYSDNLKRLADQLGHSKEAMTEQVYGHWIENDKRSAEELRRANDAATLLSGVKLGAAILN